MQITAAVPTLYYHGTSTRFLRSILVHGLDPTQITKGVWTDKSAGTISVPSKQSFGGIYLSNNFMNAFAAASNASRDGKVGGNRLMVITAIQEKSGIPDEDDYLSISSLTAEAIGNNHEHVWLSAWIQLRANINSYSVKFLDYYKTFERLVVNKYNIQISKRQDAQKLRSIMNAVLMATIQRKVSYYVYGHDGNSEFNFYRMFDLMRAILPPSVSAKMFPREAENWHDYKVPSYLWPAKPAKAEHVYQMALDKFIKATRNEGMASISHRQNIRLFTPIKFKGANRIVCLVEILPDKSQLIVHYGRLPTEFLEAWRQNIGDINKLVISDSTTVLSDVELRVEAYQGFLYGPKVGDVPFGFTEEELMLEEPAEDVPSPTKKNSKKVPPKKNTKEKDAEEEADDTEPRKPSRKSSPSSRNKRGGGSSNTRDDSSIDSEDSSDESTNDTGSDTTDEDSGEAKDKVGTAKTKKSKSLLTPKLRKALRGE